MTKEAVAKALGVHSQTIKHWERRASERFKPNDFQRTLAFLGYAQSA